ncbi:hypothetical protein QCA50_005771 [Cerrena zonata]|uniref:Skg3/CAF120-like PH-like domain-containing protein n=1 Tax=Cerrena zonata TaxID=2478898 RepID=A0AAW0GL65_9APHY
MKEIDEASKQGKQVPPSYINITDAFVHVVGAINIPAMGNQPPQKYMNVFTLNTAGLNMLLFSCPTTQALISWVSALRLAAWEKSRLEEMYSAHLLRITLNDGRDAPSPLHRGRMEGWVRVRLSGQTDWKQLWMVISAAGVHHDASSVSSADVRPGSPPAPRKKRISNLFSRDHSPPRAKEPSKPVLQLFSSPKQKDRKKALLTFRDVIQAFAVYPERPELISRSTLIKLEGLFGDEEIAGVMKNKEAWLLVMPETDGNSRASDMLKWLIGFHDAFELYGRPRMYSWDPREPQSMMFAYPIGPHKELLFLDRELAETLDVRDDRTSSTRTGLRQILWDRMRGSSPDSNQPPPIAKDAPPTLPPLPRVSEATSDEGHASGSQQRVPLEQRLSMQLPPMDFERDQGSSSLNMNKPPENQTPRLLTPITEQSGAADSTRSQSNELQAPQASRPSLSLHPPQTVPEMSQESTVAHSVYTGIMTTSPTSVTSPSDVVFRGQSEESHPGSKLSHNKRPASPPPPLPTQSAQPTQHSPPSYLQQTTNGNGNPPSTQESGRQSTSHSRPLSPEAELQTFAANVRQTTSPQWDRQSFVSLSNPHSIISSPHGTSPPPSVRQFSTGATSPTSHLKSPSISSFQSAGRSTSPAQLSQGAPTIHDIAERSSNHQTQTIRPVASRTNSNSTDTYPLPSPGAMNHPPSPFKKSVPSVPSMKEEQEEVDDNMLGDAGAALHYMRRLEGDMAMNTKPPRLRQIPPPPFDDEDEDESESETDSAGYTPPPRQQTQSPAQYQAQMQRQQTQTQTQGQTGIVPLRIQKPSSPPPPPKSPEMPQPRRGTVPMNYEQSLASSSRRSLSATGSNANASANLNAAKTMSSQSGPPATAGGLGTPNTRYSVVGKPSGARAAPGNKMTGISSSRREPPSAVPPHDTTPYTQAHSREQDMEHDDAVHGLAYSDREPQRSEDHHGFEDTSDALAALTFLDQEEQPAYQQPSRSQTQSSGPSSPSESRSVPQVLEPPRGQSPQLSTDSHQYRSSFAPSKSAAERKAKAQAQQAAHHAATHKPGRANGKSKPRHKESGAWGESSEEEEEEEEEEDDDDEDADSDDEPIPRRDRLDPNANNEMGPGRRASPGAPGGDPTTAYPQPRRPRDLPQVPQMSGDEHLGPQSMQPRRFVSDQYSEAGRRSQYPEGPRRGPSPSQPQSQMFTGQGAPRQSMWSSVLNPGQQAPQPDNHGRDTFVNIEPVEATMTKAFAPHGLLSAGLQDKQDRSAKRQEELARETGASLINVPSKPPPPQTGLLGAVTAHERERKREGGLGAALTEREREKRMAEERQRKLDEFQRMQLEQMQQTGSMYGMPMGLNPMMTGMGGMGGNPMMGNPMMPMMTGGWGYPGMMNPQHMFAAQQAAQAYQQAMMAFSVAGSQAGGDTGASPGQMNPMMTGGSMMDPRMSMMGMPMMSPAMGMNPGMGGMGSMGGLSPGMGQGMGQGMSPMGMGGMGPQMTGGSFFGGGGGTPSEMGAGGQGQRPYSQNSTGEPPRGSANASPAAR